MNGSQQVPGGGNQTVPGQVDPTPGVVTPGEASVGGAGLHAPMLVQRNRLECPKVPGQKRGIVHYYPQTGDMVCLPAGVNGAPLGLVRKNKKRAKAYISAADIKALRKISSVQKKAKAFGKLAGVSCKKR